jgi:uncharacterized protein with von Willebrand factor type A (vWA) domain
MPDLQPLLFSLFLRLRKEHLLLGIDDYLEVVQALWSGYGQSDLDELRFILSLFWVKSPEERAIFDEAFHLLVVPALTPPPAIPDPASNPPPSSSEAAEHAPQVLSWEDRGLDNRLPVRDPTPQSEENENESSMTMEPRWFAVPAFARRPGQARAVPTSSGKYQFTITAPISLHEMANIWRHLRQLKQEGPPVELNVQGTIDEISRSGFLIHPVMQPLHRNQARLLVLIDCHESMQPFKPITQAVIDSIRAGGLLRRMSLFYFSYLPDLSASPNIDLTDPLPIREVLSIHAAGGSVLIISDAGAAQGFSSERSPGRIQRFLEMLRTITYRYSWLNPFPRERWPGTSAGQIARMIPMFPFDRDGLVDTVNILRGHPFPPGIGLPNRSEPYASK